MKRLLIFLTICMFAALPAYAADTPATAPVKLLMSTSMGDITLELYPDKAPVTVKNFLDYVESGHYNGLIFHRVINGFMIQGGGMNADMQESATKAPIKNEADNGLKNERGTIAMARTNAPHSATGQFFINHKNNSPLNHKAPTNAGWGYAVFGKVIEGMDVVDKIALVETGGKRGHQDVPVKPITITSIKVVK